MGTNNIYKFTFPEAVCCCLQTCNFCFGELLSLDISIPSFIVIGTSMSKLWAQTTFTSLHFLRLFVVVYKLVIFVLVNSYHWTSVYQVSLL